MQKGYRVSVALHITKVKKSALEFHAYHSSNVSQVITFKMAKVEKAKSTRPRSSKNDRTTAWQKEKIHHLNGCE